MIGYFIAGLFVGFYLGVCLTCLLSICKDKKDK